MEDYRFEPPGLLRRMMYSRQLRWRWLRHQIHTTEDFPDLSYEYLASLEPVNVGVDMISLNLNSMISFNRSSSEFCNICQENIERHMLSRVLKCSHNYHMSCIEKHCETSNKCPTCRAIIPTIFQGML